MFYIQIQLNNSVCIQACKELRNMQARKELRNIPAKSELRNIAK